MIVAFTCKATCIHKATRQADPCRRHLVPACLAHPDLRPQQPHLPHSTTQRPARGVPPSLRHTNTNAGSYATHYPIVTSIVRRAPTMRFHLLSLLAALAPSFVFADVQFTSPAAGASIPAGAITVKWTDSGDSPSLSQLQSYTLTLMVGGQTDDTAVRISKGEKEGGRIAWKGRSWREYIGGRGKCALGRGLT